MTRLSIVLALSGSFAAVAASVAAEDIAVPVRYNAPQAHEAISDPLEGFNRRMFALDKRINRLFGQRKIAGSKGVIPHPVRTGLFNFFNNLQEPSSFANDTLQGKFGKAAVSVGRFATNSTVGVFGTFDVATKIGLKRHREDLGQTLAMYGVKAGPYIYLPVFGPSTLRDKVGDRVDGMANPLGFDTGMLGGQAISATRKVVQPHVLTVREQARNAAANGQTKDEYATLRELYYEQRAAEIADAPGSDRFTAPNATAPPLPADDVQHARLQTQRPSQAYGAAYPVQSAYAPDDEEGAGLAGYAAYGTWEDEADQAEADAAFDAANPPALPPPVRNGGYTPAQR